MSRITWTPEQLRGFWRDMHRIRAFERAAIYQSSLGKIYGALRSAERQSQRQRPGVGGVLW